MIKIVHFQRYHMELACILIITLGVNILHARFISFYYLEYNFYLLCRKFVPVTPPSIFFTGK
jgi:hypothetical protein